MAQSTVKIQTADTPHKERIQRTPTRRDWLRRLSPVLTLVLILIGWQALYMSGRYPAFLIPAPLTVWKTFVDALIDGTLIRHTWVTLQEMLIGLTAGVFIAALLGYVIAHVRWLEDVLSPLIVAFQATPVVAYAPLLIIWFGSGITAKVLTTAIIVFFPMLMNVIISIRNVPTNLRELMRVLNATRWQIFTRLELPAALPVLLTGLKTSVTLAVIGAVVGEFVNAKAGLGYLLLDARSQYDTALVFVAVFTMTALALSLYLTVSLLERTLLTWQRHIQ